MARSFRLFDFLVRPDILKISNPVFPRSSHLAGRWLGATSPRTYGGMAEVNGYRVWVKIKHPNLIG
jgi:hypothetical protein